MTEQPQQGRLLDLKQLMEWLGVSERTVRKWVNAGKIPVTRIDGRLRFDIVAIDKWITRNTHNK
tara:strand:+ start:949 stop:1140 length:192 start_codon:yes stop_codon:yes gene_type:complete